MGERRDWKSADDLLSELEQQPEFADRQRRRMEERQQNRDRYAEAAAGLLRDLDAAGYPVETLAELRGGTRGDRRLVPVLARWLPEVGYLPLKRDLIATLGCAWARPTAAGPLVEEFRRIDPAEDSAGTSVRWTIGDALERVADESVVDDLVALATDTSHGHHRALVVTALGNMRKEKDKVLPVLLGLLDDPDVAPYAVMGLGKLKAPEARPELERFLGHPEQWVRKEAKRALAKLPT